MVFFALNFLLGIMVFSVKNTLYLSTPEISLIFILILLILANFKQQKIHCYEFDIFYTRFWLDGPIFKPCLTSQ
jgi:hypothetical protein